MFWVVVTFAIVGTFFVFYYGKRMWDSMQEEEYQKNGKKYSGSVVVITGASSGIGEALAYEFSRKSARLVLCARRGDLLEKVAASCRAFGAQEVLSVPLDLSELASNRQLIDITIEKFNRLDCLILNAGVSMTAFVMEVEDPDLFGKLMRLNYLGPAEMIRVALPHLIACSGQIVGMSSVSGLLPTPLRSGYAASKAAFNAFCDALRSEISFMGVAVTMIYPGFVATEIRSNALTGSGTAVAGGTSPYAEDRIATPLVPAVQQMIRAIALRERSVIIGGIKYSIGAALRGLIPSIIDTLTTRTMMQSLASSKPVPSPTRTGGSTSTNTNTPVDKSKKLN